MSTSGRARTSPNTPPTSAPTGTEPDSAASRTTAYVVELVTMVTTPTPSWAPYPVPDDPAAVAPQPRDVDLPAPGRQAAAPDPQVEQQPGDEGERHDDEHDRGGADVVGHETAEERGEGCRRRCRRGWRRRRRPWWSATTGRRGPAHRAG